MHHSKSEVFLSRKKGGMIIEGQLAVSAIGIDDVLNICLEYCSLCRYKILYFLINFNMLKYFFVSLY